MQKKIYLPNTSVILFWLFIIIAYILMCYVTKNNDNQSNLIFYLIFAFNAWAYYYRLCYFVVLDEKGIYKKWLFLPKKLQYHYHEIDYGIHTQGEKTKHLQLKPKNKLAKPCIILLDNLQNPDKLLQDIAQYIPIQHETEKSNPVESEIGSRPLIICIGAFFLMFVSLAIKSELLQGFYLYREVWQWFLFWIIVAIIANYFFFKRDKKNQYVILTSLIVGVFSGVILSDFNLAFGRYLCEKNYHTSQTVTLKLIEQNEEHQRWQIITSEQNTLPFKEHHFSVYQNDKLILKPNVKNQALYQVEIYQTKLHDIYIKNDVFFNPKSR